MRTIIYIAPIAALTGRASKGGAITENNASAAGEPSASRLGG